MACRFRFVLCFSVLIGILFFQGMAEGSGISRPFPRKLRVEAASLLRRIVEPPISEDTVAESFEEGEDESGKGPAIGEAPESILKMEHHIHHSDKSVAGGGVIIGGLVTVIFAAVYCYIRVTRKRDEDQS